MSDNRQPTLNIPAGNSEVTPEPQGKVAGTRYMHGDQPTWDDYWAAIKQINIVQDTKNMLKWPCTREALMYGIISGTVIGALRFLGSRNVWSATRWTVGSFCTVAGGYKWNCDSNRRKELEAMRMIQERFPHRHVSNLKRKDAEWTPPPSSTATSAGNDDTKQV